MDKSYKRKQRKIDKATTNSKGQPKSKAGITKSGFNRNKYIGAPTKWDERKIIAESLEYIESCEDLKYNKKGFKEASFPSIEGLAVHLVVARETLKTWRDSYDSFAVIWETVMAKQAAALIKFGVSGEYNSSVAKMILTKHGYSDQTDVTSGGKPISSSPIDYSKLDTETLRKILNAKK